MLRTSESHPLQIASVRQSPSHGRIGLTLCPGKKDSHALTGGWNRNLQADLDVIEDWGAVLVLTLVEQHELEALKVAHLEKEVRHRGMEWRHLPIEDVSTPSEAFEKAWRAEGEFTRALLRERFDVLVHCRGGLGRAGTIAARLLVELGQSPQKAIASVRAVRPGAIETPEQEESVLKTKMQDEPVPSKSDRAIKNRAIGGLIGLAVGDAAKAI